MRFPKVRASSAFVRKHVSIPSLHALPPRSTRVDEVVRFSRKQAGRRGMRFFASLPVPALIAVCSFVVMLWVFVGLWTNHEYHSALKSAKQQTSNLTLAFEESTRRVIGQINQTLLSARAFYLAQGEHFDFLEWAQTQTIADSMTAAIGLADANGEVFADTLPIPPHTSIADRRHFKVHLNPELDELFISHPVFGRVSGQATIQFTRKLFGTRHEFAGVAVFSLGCAELSRFYQTVDLGRGFVALLSLDGTVLARGPLAMDRIGKPLTDGELGHLVQRQSGTMLIQQPNGAAGQIVSFRRVPEYPLIVAVGVDETAAFRGYRALRNRALVSATIVSGVICLIAALWLAQKRRSLAAQRALSVTLETISQGILMVDERRGVPVINPQALALLGISDSDTASSVNSAAMRALELASSQHIPRHTGTGEPIQLYGGAAQESCSDMNREDGSIIEVRSYMLPSGGLVQTYSDVTTQRLADAQIRRLAHYDSLTGLVNRFRLRQILSEFLGEQSDPSKSATLIMIDLDGFKGVNDSLGHSAGDELLVEVARQIQSVIRETDIVARLGGDEFVILLPELHEPGKAVPLLQRVFERLTEPKDIGGQQVRVGASAGIALYPRDGRDPDTLLKHADIALYSAKAKGRGTYCYFDRTTLPMISERSTLVSDLRRALTSNELEVHFQPKFDCTTLRVVGFEALSRWRHPVKGYISPATFIRIAEETGLIQQLGYLVLDHACQTAATWTSPYPVAVNVSVAQLYGDNLQQQIAEVLERTGLPAGRLEIEVTESVMADENRSVLECLHALKNLGIQIALDDFGTGYSSLAYLRRFPFNKIKIDKSFIQGQTNDQGMRVILDAILGMCQNLGLATVGEGVETAQQLAFLQEHGCTELQGYLLARPMGEKALDGFFQNNRRLPRGSGNQTSHIRLVS